MDASTPVSEQVDRWQTHEIVYRRIRRLEMGVERTPISFCEGLAREALEAEEGPSLMAELSRAVDQAGELSVISLNVWGLIALRLHGWPAAKALSSEVTARDHHDLLGQRIFDASVAKSDTLETPVEAWLADRVCTAPFEEMETRENGDIHFCCSAWQPVPIGRIGRGENPWRSANAREIRRSVTEGDFTHCSRWHCPRIAERRLARVSEAREPPVTSGPSRVVLSHDRSCNLACPSCRTSLIQLDHAGSQRMDELYREQLAPLVERADRVKVTGSGDPFGSRHFRQVISEIAVSSAGRRRLQLHTNGLLLNDRAWDDLHLWGSVASIWISVDAARAETYARLRGGDFARLMDNLAFLAELRKVGELPYLRLDMVIQRDNLDEAPEFVDLANRVGADGVYFLRLRNWGTFTATAFRELDVCHPEHPEHAVLLGRLADPRMGTPGVELGSLAPLREAALRTRPDCAGSF
jgi:pyruvate-formate lyase-activating enzyme